MGGVRQTASHRSQGSRQFERFRSTVDGRDACPPGFVPLSSPTGLSVLFQMAILTGYFSHQELEFGATCSQKAPVAAPSVRNANRHSSFGKVLISMWTA